MTTANLRHLDATMREAVTTLLDAGWSIARATANQHLVLTHESGARILAHASGDHRASRNLTAAARRALAEHANPNA